MLIAAAVCPHPPLLVPELASGAASELDDVRAACDSALAVLAAAEPDDVVVVGSGSGSVRRVHPAETGGDLSGFGARFTVGPAPARLPLSLTIGRWLAGRAGLRVRRFVEVAPDTGPAECARLGVELAAGSERLGLVVMGDGSARRPPASPGRPDERALAFDAMVAEALESGDAETLMAIDPYTAAELMVAGRPVWQVLAGAAEGIRMKGELFADEAPYGVGYFAASWTL